MPLDAITQVVTSGEVLWQSLASAGSPGVQPTTLHAIAARPEDVAAWFTGLPWHLPVQQLADADAILLLGLPDHVDLDDFANLVRDGVGLGLPLICANPDRMAQRGDRMTIGPGALADRYAAAGGRVERIGKPGLAVFDAVAACVPAVPRSRMLMIGDSLEHDIAGASDAGLLTLFVSGGIHAAAFPPLVPDADTLARIVLLAAAFGPARPDFSIPRLK